MKRIPYGRQFIDENDIETVVEVLRSDWLTTGPEVDRFEEALAAYCDVEYAVVLNSGTAALHAAYFAAGVGPGDEVLTSPLTFAATANAALYLGAKVVFADVQPDTGNLDPGEVVRKISDRTRVVAPIDYTGHPCDLDELMEVAHRWGAVVVEDACHAIGAKYKRRPIGGIADMTVLSFHPVKHITTCEGGAVLTQSAVFAERIRAFRTHGIVGKASGGMQYPWFREMEYLGYNYRLPDVLCALGRSQLGKIEGFLEKRREIAAYYTQNFSAVTGLKVPAVRDYVNPAWHLYVIRLNDAASRLKLYNDLRETGIGVQVHYVPVYKHPYYQHNRGKWEGFCPEAEKISDTCLSLPIFFGLTEEDAGFVVSSVINSVEKVT